MHKNKFIVSNGFNKYPLSDAATEFDKSASLKFFITGAYPLNILKKIIKFFSLNKLNFINRFFLRSVNIKDELVYSLFISDFIFFFGIFTLSNTNSPVDEALRDNLPCVSGVEKPSMPFSTINPLILFSSFL